MRIFWRFVCALSVAGLIVASNAAAQVHCTATFRLDDAVSVGALQLGVEYPRPDASFDGSGSSVACTSLVAAIPNFYDDDAGTLAMGFVALGGGFAGPHDLAVCEMTTAAGITENDLAVTVTDATSPDLAPMSPPAVSPRVTCDGDPTTTTTTSTTTTTLPEVLQCVITVSLNDPVTVGSLQTVVHYQNADGDFNGSGANAECTTVAPGIFGSYFDNEAARTVGAALISLVGLTGPSGLYTCTFSPAAGIPAPGDFSITIVDAGDTDANPIVPTPAVAISDIACFNPATTTTTTTSSTTTTVTVCGDGKLEGAEECDDGNLVAFDGCSPSCTIEAVCGDVDGNESINVVDAQRILRGAVGLPPHCPLDVCDATGDGVVTVGDAQRVLRRAVGLPAQLLCH